MLIISDELMTAFTIQTSDIEVTRLRDKIVSENPHLSSIATLRDRIEKLVGWALCNRIETKFDVEKLVELAIIHQFDLHNDDDFNELLSDPAIDRKFIMLRFLQKKPAEFWEAVG